MNFRDDARKNPKKTQNCPSSVNVFALEDFKQLEEHEGRAQLEAFGILEKKMSIAFQLEFLSKKNKQSGSASEFLGCVYSR